MVSNRVKLETVRSRLGSFTSSCHYILLVKVSPKAGLDSRGWAIGPISQWVKCARGIEVLLQLFCKQSATFTMISVLIIITMFNITALFYLRLKRKLFLIENSTPWPCFHTLNSWLIFHCEKVAITWHNFKKGWKMSLCLGGSATSISPFLLPALRSHLKYHKWRKTKFPLPLLPSFHIFFFLWEMYLRVIK